MIIYEANQIDEFNLLLNIIWIKHYYLF